MSLALMAQQYRTKPVRFQSFYNTVVLVACNTVGVVYDRPFLVESLEKSAVTDRACSRMPRHENRKHPAQGCSVSIQKLLPKFLASML